MSCHQNQPSHPLSLSLTGKVYFAKGDADRARAAYVKAAGVDGAAAAPHRGLAEVAAAAGDDAGVVAALTRALELTPLEGDADEAAIARHVTACVTLARAHERLGQQADAARAFGAATAAAIPATPAHTDAVLGAARTSVASGDTDTAALDAAAAVVMGDATTSATLGSAAATAVAVRVAAAPAPCVDALLALAAIAGDPVPALEAALEAAAWGASAADVDPTTDERWQAAATALTAAAPTSPAARQAAALIEWADAAAGRRHAPTDAAWQDRVRSRLAAISPKGATVSLALSRLAFADGDDVVGGKAARTALRSLKARGVTTGEAPRAARALAARAKAAAGDSAGAAADWRTVLKGAGDTTHTPYSAARDAARGLAAAASAAGDAAAALQEWHRLAATPGAEHWAHGELGCALLAAGDADAAAPALQAAVDTAVSGGGGASDSDVAAYRVALGRALWRASPPRRTDAAAAWLAAAAVPCPSRGAAFAGLADFYEGERGDVARALACRVRAIDADPVGQQAAAKAAVAALSAAGAFDHAVAVASRVADAAPSASWAWAALARSRAARGDADAAVAAWHGALRASPHDATAWTDLGAAYAAAGRAAASARAFVRAGELAGDDGARAHAAASAASMALVAGDWDAADRAVAAAIYTPAGAAASGAAVLRRALAAARAGATGAATAFAARAERASRAAAGGAPTAAAPRKLAGDAALVVAMAGGSVADDEAAWTERASAGRCAAASYAAALIRAPWAALSWGDAAAALAAVAAACRCAPSGDEDAATAASAAGAVAARCARTGLRVDGARARLWRALGEAPSTPATSEACLFRALTLDPTDGGAWASLARVYAREGAPDAAASALAAARSHAPAHAAVWAAAGAVHAKFGDTTSSVDDYNHALTLGGGVEASLAVAEAAAAAATRGAPFPPAAAAAASRAAACRPDCAPARAAAGAAALATGDAGRGVREWEAAAQLLAAPLPAAWTVATDDAVTPPLILAELGVARALAAAGDAAGAAGVYGRPHVAAALATAPPPERLVAAAATAAVTGDTAGLAALTADSTVGAHALRCALGVMVATTPRCAATAAANTATAAAKLDADTPGMDALCIAVAAAACVGGAQPSTAVALATTAARGAPTPAAVADCWAAAADAAGASDNACMRTSCLARAARACPWRGDGVAALAATRGCVARALAAGGAAARRGRVKESVDALRVLVDDGLCDGTEDGAAAATALAAWPHARPACVLAAAAAATPTGGAREFLARRAAHAAPWDARRLLAKAA